MDIISSAGRSPAGRRSGTSLQAASKATSARLEPLILAKIQRGDSEGKPFTSADNLAGALGAKAATVRATINAMIEAGRVIKDTKRSPFKVGNVESVPTSESVP